MTSFQKAKIGMALTLLVVSFAIYPIIREHGNIGFSFVGVHLEIRAFYYAFVAFLSVAVYAYATNLITERSTKVLNRVGNVVYALALVVPILCGVLWIGSLVGNPIISVLGKLTSARLTRWFVWLVLFLLTGMLFYYLEALLERMLSRRDQEARINQFSLEEVSHIGRASEFFQSGFNDLTVFEASKAVEFALRKAAEKQGIAITGKGFEWVAILSSLHKVVSKETARLVKQIGDLRNAVIHGEMVVGKSEAEQVLEKTRVILGAIARQVEAEAESREAGEVANSK